MIAFCCRLPQSTYRVSGKDAKTFLQGQLSQDIGTISPERCHYGAYCNPKGRMLANFFIFTDNADDILLTLHERQAETAIKRLSMFILRDKVDIKASDASIFGLNRSAAEQLCATPSIALPQPFTSTAITTGQFTGQLCALPNDLFLWIADDSSALQTFTQNPDAIQTLRLMGGHYDVLPETNEKILPQQTPLEAWGSINYEKGCYVGQEIIARNKYRGKVKKNMAIANIAKRSSHETIAPGDGIEDEGKTVGEIISCYSGETNSVYQALITIEAISKPCRVNGQTMTFAAVPNTQLLQNVVK